MTSLASNATGVTVRQIKTVIIEYPSVSKSAVFGFLETMELASAVCRELGVETEFVTAVYRLEAIGGAEIPDVVVLPPCSGGTFYMQDCDVLNQYLTNAHQQGAVLASACVGSFMLARGGFLDNKFCTTHWRLGSEFSEMFPKAKLNINAMIVNEGNVITAGGRMAWLDLAFEVISSFCPPSVATHLSKEMVTDTGYREQAFYRQFMPRMDHGDPLVLQVQTYFNEHFSEVVSVSGLAKRLFVSTRTLQRRFQNAVGLTVVEYLQKLRLHNACQLIELSNKSISEVSYLVGYHNVSAFRKIFNREYGLTPSEFRKRFQVD
ncbi:GlxA family transcriptional regulator [Endozoicomonas sp. ALB032]|uniref:GlxA family transcriptional regulator n=1 Tax=Endozoicomonas sp. ALB032 TaxID=3403082 RepID=UPI003BB5932A